MKPKAHQRRAARKLVARVLKYGLAILAGEPRSGKTLSFIEACDILGLKNILIITKKDALKGIKDACAFYPHINFTVTNFHQVKNLTNIDQYQLVIIDEFHRYVSNASPKATSKALWNEIYIVVYLLPIIFSSGTPTPEGYASIYSALALSIKSPFKDYKNFTAWHKDYGIPYDIVIEYDKINNRIKRKAKGWNKAQTYKVKAVLEPYTVTITQKEAGHVHFAKDNLIDVPLSHRQERIYKILNRDKLYLLPNNFSIVADKTNVNQKLHQIAGGFVRINNDYDELDNKKVYQFNQLPKVEHIKANYDVNKIIVFAFYEPEQKYLKSIFPNVESITKKSEGTDYSHIDKMVIYSFGFAAVTYEQIRVRQMNFMKRDTPIEIDILISGIDGYVYQAVSSKKNFTASWYKKIRRD